MSDTSSRPTALGLALGGLLSLAAAMGIGRFVYTPILPSMAEGAPLSASEAGLVASANFLGYLIGALAAARGSLPGSMRSWFLGALFLSALTSAAMGLATEVTSFLVLRFAGGVASAFVLVFSSALVLERLAAMKRPELSAVHFAGVGIGIALSALLINTLNSRQAEWPDLWFASGAVTLALLLAAALLIKGDGDGKAASAAQESRTVDAPLGRLIAAYGLFGFGYVITATFISLIVRENAVLSPAEPWVWLAFGLAAAPSVYLWNRIAAVIGARSAFAVACIIEAGGVALSVAGLGPAAVVLASILLGGTFMGITALGLVEARRITPGDPRRTLALMTASFGLGQMIGPWCAGLLRDATGSYTEASLAAALALVLAAALARR